MNKTIKKDASGVGLLEKQFFTFAGPPHEMKLDSGARLGPITLAYETYGRLNAEKTNAVLVCHALSGDAHAAGYHREDDPRPGWWDFMIGPGRGIDTNRYFVICSNILGSCMGSTGPCTYRPDGSKPYGLSFPFVTIGDMVKAQKALVDHLGIQKLVSVIGGSIGGMQVLEWCIQFPDMTASAIPIATTTRHSALSIAFNETARQSIMADPNWNSGDYYGGVKPDAGLAVARMIGHITYLSDESLRQKFGRRLQNREDFSFQFDADFQVENYLRYQGKKFVDRFDANSFLYITKAADYFDLNRKYGEGSLVRAFASAKAKFLVISFTSDWLYPTFQSRDINQALKKNGLDVSFCEIKADCGHDAFLLPLNRQSDLIKGFLNGVSTETQT
jgi:homoserine O-acetyltransferase